MTARAPGQPSRGANAPTRSTWTRDGVGAILIVLALGLAFRIIIAYLFPGTGLSFDLASFRGWADNLANEGLSGFYQRPFFHDYMPGYLYVLYLVGLVGRAVGGIGDLIKLPPILADVALSGLAWSMARELGAGRRAAIIAGIVVVANPVLWFDSVTWGQVDSFGLVFLLLGVRALWRDQPERAALWAVVAALIKPQLGILIPIVAAVTIRRALWPIRSGEAVWEGLEAREPSSRGLLSRLRDWERQTGKPIRILTTALVGFVTALILCAPFGLSVIEFGGSSVVRSGLLDQVLKTAAGYPYVTVNAYNPWALAQLGGNSLASGGGFVCDVVIPNTVAGGAPCDAAVMMGPFPALFVGSVLIAAAVGLVSLIAAWRPDRLTILVGVSVLAIAFFVLPTRVHERYMMPFFATGAVLAAISLRWLVAYLVLSVTTFLNMYVVLTTIYPGNPGIQDWLGIGSEVRSPMGVTLIALANLGACLWVFAELRRGARDRFERDVARSRLEDGSDAAEEGRGILDLRLAHVSERAATDRDADRAVAPDAQPAPTEAAQDESPASAPDPAWAGASWATSRTSAVADKPSVPARLPTWTEPPSFAEAGIVGWFGSRINARPIRADRSRALHGESTGRIDRLDLWFAVVLVVAILGLRMFRLAEPYQMHFDEVYHARTATEFMQYWRYGISHDIYEWTHPHLAKYAMAGGLIAWGDDRVSAVSSLGLPVRDAIVETRRDNPRLPGGRGGDRVHVATGSELRSYDLATRRLVYAAAVPGATAMSIDPVSNLLFIGTSDGRILSLDLKSLDGLTGGVAANGGSATTVAPAPEAFATVDGSIQHLYASQDGQTLFVATDAGRLVTIDSASAQQLASVAIPGIADFAQGGSGPAVIAGKTRVHDPAAAASILAGILGGKAADYRTRLESGADGSTVAGISASQQKASIEAAIADGRLAGLSVTDMPRVAVAASTGVVFVSAATGDILSTTSLSGGAKGLAAADLDGIKLYATTGQGALGAPGGVAIIAAGGDAAKDGPVLQRTLPLPGQGSRVAYDNASQMIHVLGRAPDGQPGWTIYVIETHGNAVFADARLPFEPTAWAIDIAKAYPTDDRQQILAFGGNDELASVEIGKHAFAWRVPGVIAGALMAGLLYLLTRILFRRRSVALLVGAMAIADGMLFVQSRIGMNDAYVGLGIVAAYTLFAAIWTRAWRWRGAFWVVMPIIGVFLGLALASKWVALYAIGALGLLILARSALGRLMLIAGLIAATALLGHLAIAVPAGAGLGNLTFVAIMVGLTVAAVAVSVLHPIAWSDDEIRFAFGAPAALGAIVALAAIALNKAGATVIVGPIAATPLHLAAALVATSLLVGAAFVVGGWLGVGPLATKPHPADPASLLPPSAPPPEAAWLRPGAQLGLPILWMAICLLVIPLGLYVASYLPWAMIEGHRITDTWPPGNTGQTLIDLTKAMYDYHNNLTAGHAASSPWWAWPFDLKPVWFYQEGLAGSTTASIYDAGNLVIWWLGVPAMAFVAWQAYARRSLGLALIAIGFACQWVSWTRIDRAAFQYHYYTSLPSVIMAVAYFIAEIWHGPSRRTWLLARAAAAVAILGPALLWLFNRPLCGFVGVQRANPGSQACPPVIPDFVLTLQTLVLGGVICLAVLLFLWQLARLGRGDRSRGGIMDLLPLGAIAVIGLLASAGARLLSDEPIVTLTNLPVEPIVVILALPLVLLAAFVITARDARRFVVGALTAIFAWFLVLYPNIAALPLPATIANAYQGILPTYLYAFQFPVNQVPHPSDVKLLDPIALGIGVAVAVLCIVIAYSAWVWRIALAERDADRADVDPTGFVPGAPRG